MDCSHREAFATPAPCGRAEYHTNPPANPEREKRLLQQRSSATNSPHKQHRLIGQPSEERNGCR